MARVVIVDDSADLRALMRIVVVNDGHEVVGEGADGREAIELAASLAPDVVVLDVRMPNMSGLEALPVIARSCPSAKVVVVNSLPGVTVEKVRSLGGHELLHRRDNEQLGATVSSVAALRS